MPERNYRRRKLSGRAFEQGPPTVLCNREDRRQARAAECGFQIEEPRTVASQERFRLTCIKVWRIGPRGRQSGGGNNRGLARARNALGGTARVRPGAI